MSLLNVHKLISIYQRLWRTEGKRPSMQALADAYGANNPATGRNVTRQGVHFSLTHHEDGKALLDYEYNPQPVKPVPVLMIRESRDMFRGMRMPEHIELVWLSKLTPQFLHKRVVYGDMPVSLGVHPKVVVVPVDGKLMEFRVRSKEVEDVHSNTTDSL